MNANELRNQIKRLLNELAVVIEDDMQKDVDQIDDPVKATVYLLQIADSNRSQWSGGHTFSNMIEQETREIALKLARREGYQLQGLSRT